MVNKEMICTLYQIQHLFSNVNMLSPVGVIDHNKLLLHEVRKFAEWFESSWLFDREVLVC